MDNLITRYLQQDSHLLGNLLSKLNQLRQWNAWLGECLEENTVLAQHCFIVNLSGTSLIVLADNPHWLTRFRFHIPTLLPKLQHYPGLENIQSICCKVQPNYVPTSPSNQREPQQKLSSENASLLRETAKKVTDEKLRIALEKIADHS